MAIIYNKQTDSGDKKCLVLGTREGLVYPFDVGDWTELRIGMFLSFVGDDGTFNTEVGNRSKQNFSLRDNWFLGLKGTADDKFPTEDGNYFIGLHSDLSFPFSRIYFEGISPRTTQLREACLGVIHPNGAAEQTQEVLTAETHESNTSAFSFFLGIRMVIHNKGMSNQYVTMYHCMIANLSSNISDSYLRNLLVGDASWSLFVSDDGVRDFHLNGVPYPVPEAFFIYTGLQNLCTRVHNIGAYRVS